MKQGVEDIISFSHCGREYANETMKDKKKKLNCQSPAILSSHKEPVSTAHRPLPSIIETMQVNSKYNLINII